MVLTWPYLGDFFLIISSISGRYSTHAHFFFVFLEGPEGVCFSMFFSCYFWAYSVLTHAIFFSNGCVFCPFLFFWGFFWFFPLNLAFFVVLCGIFRNGSFKYTMCFFICFFLRSLTALSVFNCLLSIWCFGKCQSGTIYSFIVVIFTCHRTLCHMLRFVSLRTRRKTHTLQCIF